MYANDSEQARRRASRLRARLRRAGYALRTDRATGGHYVIDPNRNWIVAGGAGPDALTLDEVEALQL